MKYKTYEGNVEINKQNQEEWKTKLKNTERISGYIYIHSNAKLSALKSVGGNISINSNAKLSASNLNSIGGDIYIYSDIGIKLEKQLWKNNSKNEWYVTNLCSDWLLSQKGKFIYRINDVEFGKVLFDKVRKDKLSPEEVFKLENIEQRRVAYELMDKAKMKSLDGYKVLNKKKDNYGNKMSIVSFDLAGYDKPFKYLQCICPSTGREYFIETKQDTCEKAKAKSFGREKVNYKEEW